MARPPLPLGTWGEIKTTRLSPDGETPARWVARARFRDYDGVTRKLERHGTTSAKATRALRSYLQDRSGARTELTTGSRFADAVPPFMDEVARHRSGTTYDRYRSRLDNHLLPAVGQLLLRECTPGRLARFMGEMDRNGLSANSRRGIRSVLSGVMQVAVDNEIISANPVRHMGEIKGGTTRAAEALSSAELADFLTKMDEDDLAVRADLPDLVRLLFGTGVRIGEALALRWRDLNLVDEPVTMGGEVIPAQSMWINAHVVTVKGTGLVRADGASNRTKKSYRVLPLPDYLYTLLLVRKPLEAHDDEPVFPSGTLGWRHPSNLQRSIRRMRERIDYPDFTTHVGRKTVATVLDQSGQSARQIADQLGHANPSMTQNVYMGRGMLNPEAAEALDKAHRQG